jgi:PKD repeat protein
VVAAEWDFDGTGTFPVISKLITAGGTASRVAVNTSYSFAKPGTYFVTLRVTSQREGDAKTPFARIRNLGRVRVIVKSNIFK